MTTLIGVDFSGARSDSDTWAAMATADDAGALTEWHAPFPIRRADLEQLLLTVDAPAIAALDFPFGLPADFAVTQGFIRWGEGLMDSCDRMSTTDQAEFERVARDYSAVYGLPRRASDVAPAFSPLNTVNPNMMPMTYHGMSMLGRLLARAPGRFMIPPLPANASRWQVALIELMPGQLLRARDDPGTRYKTGAHTGQRRHEILSRLEAWIGAPLPEHVRLACRANPDCLDAVVNLAGALAWHRSPDAFEQPGPTQRGFAHDEGWLYALKEKRRDE